MSNYEPACVCRSAARCCSDQHSFRHKVQDKSFHLIFKDPKRQGRWYTDHCDEVLPKLCNGGARLAGASNEEAVEDVESAAYVRPTLFSFDICK